MTFGKFKESFLAEVHAEILSHVNQEASSRALQPVEGITLHDSEVLEPEPVREGGLIRKGTVCIDCGEISVHSPIVIFNLVEAHFPATCKTNRTSHSSDFDSRTRSSSQRKACSCGW